MEVSSSLTELDSNSSPESFHTAQGSPLGLSPGSTDVKMAATEEDPVGDGTTLVEEEEEELGPEEVEQYREAKPMLHELAMHAQIQIEEQLYSHAISLLEGFLTDGNATTTKPKPARIPPPAQIAVLNSMTIHPIYTSRAPEAANLDIAAQATKYLRGLLHTVGPVNANMRDAFQFKELVDKRGGRHPKRTSRPTRNGSGGAMHNVKAMNGHGGKDIFDEDDDQYANGNNNNNDNDGNDSDGSGYWDWESDGEVHSRLAQEQSVWRRAPDFWTVLGWAFRCAAQYPKRWQYWELWLEYMLDVLDMDWDDRLGYDQHEQMLKKQEAEEAETKTKPKTKKKDKDKYPMLEQSLLVAYLDDLHRERKNVVREVMRALFAYADADADVNQNNSKQGADSGVYKEIFNKETAPPVNKKERTKRKREKLMLDLEHDKFGDYYLDQNEFDLEGDGTVDLDDFDEDDEGQYEVKQEEEYGSDASTPRAYTAKSKAKANGIHRGDSDAETDASELPIPPPRRGRGRPTKARPATSAAAKQNGTRIPARGGRNAGPTIPDGVADTISIRQRLFRLLSGASYYIEDKSCAEIHDLYEMYTDRVRQLPLGAFRLFVQPHSTSLPDDIYVSFMRHLIDKFLPTSGLPDPWEVDYEAAQINGFSLAMLEQCFLPFAANKVAVEDNAKLSIVLESMCWFIYARRGCDLEVSPSLKRAVEKGIAAREERSKPRQSQRIITNRFRRNVIDDDDDDSDDDNNDNYDNTIQKEKDKTAKRALDRSARNLMVWVNYHEGTTSSI